MTCSKLLHISKAKNTRIPVFCFPVLAWTGGSRPSPSTPAPRAPPLPAPGSSSLSAPLPLSAP